MTSDLSPEQLTRVFACGIGGLEAGLIVNTGARLSLTPTVWRSVLAAVGLGVLLVTVAGVPLVLALLSLRARGVLPERGTSRGVWASVWAPANLAHEATHALVALVLGVEFDMVRRDDGRLGIDLAIDETVPVWGVVLASLARHSSGVSLARCCSRGFWGHCRPLWASGVRWGGSSLGCLSCALGGRRERTLRFQRSRSDTWSRSASRRDARASAVFAGCVSSVSSGTRFRVRCEGGAVYFFKPEACALRHTP
ncbi:hypothetical protein A4G99_03815 [Haladaptatus sp. R4]|uniref:hypothetical protein n=1 Tax=Haladaptatus sp. R4 TaxID=1679489 RepID=UPI0007B495CD|nr:hypothetical protein [Haladaptatus sp. R4]KZN25607.1 hypothetical protein A4G99_03815 [Haladaptatus sp. R4]